MLGMFNLDLPPTDGTFATAKTVKIVSVPFCVCVYLKLIADNNSNSNNSGYCLAFPLDGQLFCVAREMHMKQ